MCENKLLDEPKHLKTGQEGPGRGWRLGHCEKKVSGANDTPPKTVPPTKKKLWAGLTREKQGPFCPTSTCKWR